MTSLFKKITSLRLNQNHVHPADDIFKENYKIVSVPDLSGPNLNKILNWCTSNLNEEWKYDLELISGKVTIHVICHLYDVLALTMEFDKFEGQTCVDYIPKEIL